MVTGIILGFLIISKITKPDAQISDESCFLRVFGQWMVIVFENQDESRSLGVFGYWVLTVFENDVEIVVM